jgi:osmotically-inducible protein OsmY
MANERGRRGEYREDYGNQGQGYGDRSGPMVRGGDREYGSERYQGDYGQQRGGHYTVDTGRRPEDRGRSYGDWLGGSDENDYPSRQGGSRFGGYGQQASDYRGRGYRGRGPRGYARSDERIREDVNDRLTDDWMLDASDIEVEVSNCEVTLSGEVASRSDKRHAEEIAESVSGVRDVQNNLRVRRGGETAAGTA